MVGLDRDGAIVACDRLAVALEIMQHRAAIVERARRGRPSAPARDRSFAERPRGVRCRAGCRRDCRSAATLRGLTSTARSISDEPGLAPPALRFQHAQEMQRVGIVRLHPQHVAIERLSLARVAPADAGRSRSAALHGSGRRLHRQGGGLPFGPSAHSCSSTAKLAGRLATQMPLPHCRDKRIPASACSRARVEQKPPYRDCAASRDLTA